VAHHLAELIFDLGAEGSLATVRNWLGEAVHPDHPNIPVDEEMVEVVSAYVEQVRNMTRGADYFAVEEQVEIGSANLGLPPGVCWGTADTVAVKKEELQVHDLKTGRGVPVSAEGNTQLRLYALGVLAQVELLFNIERVRVVIHQPRLDSVSEEVLTVEELRAWAKEQRVNARLAHELATGKGKPESYLQPSDSACRWCRAKATCPALTARVEAEIGASFDDLTVQSQIAPSPELDAIALARAMEAVDLVESWCKAVRAETERRLVGGQDVPGYKLVQGRRGARAWSQQEEAEALLRSFKLKVEDIYDLKLISPTSAEKLAKAGTVGPRQWAKVQAFITQAEGKPSVAPASDPRPAITVAATADDFDAL
jgi:hypothetical protein